jgi:hypothetical protein
MTELLKKGVKFD